MPYQRAMSDGNDGRLGVMDGESSEWKKNSERL